MKRLLNRAYLGYFKYKCKRRGITIERSCIISSDDIFEGNNHIAGCVKGSKVGYGTYIMNGCYPARVVK